MEEHDAPPAKEHMRCVWLFKLVYIMSTHLTLGDDPLIGLISAPPHTPNEKVKD